jgi:hypothetical protein
MDDVSFKGMRGREYRALTIALKENTERHFASTPRYVLHVRTR